MSTHTPGPWTMSRDKRSLNALEPVTTSRGICDEKGAVLANVWTPGPNRLAERDPNARLIAAAPELLKALQWAMVYLTKYPLATHDHELRDIFAENLEFCNATIAKTEG